MRQTPHAPTARRDHVAIIDGTLSSLEEGCETHAGRLFRLLNAEPGASVVHHPGVQGDGWRKWWNAVTGEGLNEALLAVYADLARRWRPGDRIFLFGYSRGAYAARSLAGFIGRVGLLRPKHAGSPQRLAAAFAHYQQGADTPRSRRFSARFCRRPEIEMIGAWDTVKALGPPYPILARLAPFATQFHDASLGPHVRAGYHALALDEDRQAFAPKLWRARPDWTGRLEQVWFPGAHGDVGGERSCDLRPLPLSLHALVWMLERAERHGLALPAGWRGRFRLDPAAPMVGARKGIGRLFLRRRPRDIAAVDGGALHPSVAARQAAVPSYRPRPLRRARGAAPTLSSPTADFSRP